MLPLPFLPDGEPATAAYEGAREDTNIGIMPIDKIDPNRAARDNPYRAIVGAALSCFRLIVITRFTSFFGLVRLTLSADLLIFSMVVIPAREPAFGTALTQGAVPVLYDVLSRV